MFVVLLDFFFENEQMKNLFRIFFENGPGGCNIVVAARETTKGGNTELGGHGDLGVAEPASPPSLAKALKALF